MPKSLPAAGKVQMTNFKWEIYAFTFFDPFGGAKPQPLGWGVEGLTLELCHLALSNTYGSFYYHCELEYEIPSSSMFGVN
jgi:hypothetical protein